MPVAHRAKIRMWTPRPKALATFGLASLAVVAAAGALVAAQPGRARQSMEQCVDRVLTQLSRSGVPENQVGSLVVTHCDKQLRATLAEAVNSGEAGFCTVESCLGLARGRAAAEATETYRQHAVR